MDNISNEENVIRTVMTDIKTPDLEIPYEACLIQGIPDPCMIVIVGASGDLTSRKLIPALYNLFVYNVLPDPFVIVGCARTKMSNEEFRDKIKKAIIHDNKPDSSKSKDFLSKLHYQEIDYEDISSFMVLAEFLKKTDMKCGTKGNKVFYLAIPPSLYMSTAQMLGKASLASEEEDGSGWSRIVVGKPFGWDLDTAIDLDRALHENFKEHQIFRIDHYLAKETVQNILMFRFAMQSLNQSGIGDTWTM